MKTMDFINKKSNRIPGPRTLRSWSSAKIDIRYPRALSHPQKHLSSGCTLFKGFLVFSLIMFAFECKFAM